MRNKKVKQLRKEFRERFGREPRKHIIDKDGVVRSLDEFRQFKKGKL